MPPCLDVYVLTAKRDLEMIERFVREYTSSDLDAPHDCDLMVVPADYDGESELITEDHFDHVHLDTLGAAIRYGLAEPGRAFWLYFGRAEPWCGAMMAFTLSNELALGVSVDDPDDGTSDEQPLEDARRLMAQLAELPEVRHAWLAGRNRRRSTLTEMSPGSSRWPGNSPDTRHRATRVPEGPRAWWRLRPRGGRRVAASSVPTFRAHSSVG